MARLLTRGFELQSAVAGMEFDGIGGVAAISTSTFRGGAAAGEIAPGGSNVPHYFASQFATSAAVGPYWLRFYLYVHTAPTTTPTTVAYLHSAKITSSATVPVASIQMTTSRTLTLWDGNAQVGSASAALTADTWYRVDLKIDGTPASGSRVIEARVGGAVFATTSASTSTVSVNWFGVGGNIGNSATTTGGDWFLDDLAVNDGAAGGTQTSYPPSARVLRLLVTGAGNPDFANAFIDGDGGGGTNASKVDDSPTPDNSTTWVKRDEAAGTATRGDMYTFTDPVSAGIGSSDTVNVVHVEIRGGAGSNSANNARNLQARLKSKATGTAVDGSAVAFNSLTTTAWVTNGVTAPTLPCLTSYTSPHSGTAWTVTGTEDSLTSLQAGYQTQSTTGNFTNGARVTAIWLTVEYSPGPIVANLATESDTAFTVAHKKSKPLGMATEADTAVQLIVPRTARMASEADTAFTFAHTKKRTLGVATESDVATPVTRLFRANMASEADTAVTITPGKTWAIEVGMPDPGTGYVITRASATVAELFGSGDVRMTVLRAGIVLEQSAWIALTATPTVQTLIIGLPVGGTGFSVRFELRTFSELIESISDVSLTAVFGISGASETDTAFALTHKKRYVDPFGIATELDTAFTIIAPAPQRIVWQFGQPVPRWTFDDPEARWTFGDPDERWSVGIPLPT